MFIICSWKIDVFISFKWTNLSDVIHDTTINRQRQFSSVLIFIDLIINSSGVVLISILFKASRTQPGEILSFPCTDAIQHLRIVIMAHFRTDKLHQLDYDQKQNKCE